MFLVSLFMQVASPMTSRAIAYTFFLWEDFFLERLLNPEKHFVLLAEYLKDVFSARSLNMFLLTTSALIAVIRNCFRFGLLPLFCQVAKFFVCFFFCLIFQVWKEIVIKFILRPLFELCSVCYQLLESSFSLLHRLPHFSKVSGVTDTVLVI